MKKMLSLLCVMALLLTMVGVGGVSFASAMTSDEARYKGVLTMFYNGVSSQWNTRDGYGENTPTDPDSVSYMFPQYYKHCSLSQVGYALIDLNNDGKKELLVSPMEVAKFGQIFDLYTVVNGSVVHSYTSGERYMLTLASDRTLNHYGSSSAFTSVTTNYTLNASTGALKVKKAVIYDAWENQNNPYFYATSDYRNKDGSYNYSKLTSITSSRADSILAAFPKDAALSLTPLSSFDPSSAVTYKVSFSANGGSGAPAAQTKVTGTPLTLSMTMPTRSGYAFAGWSTSASATTAQYQPGDAFKNNANTTLYAVWKSGVYRVTFHPNGGSEVPAPQFKTPGTALTLATKMPKRSGYAFVGWATSASATTASYQPGSSFKNNAHTTLYAVWQKGTYRVSFNANGGSGAPSPQFKIPGTPLTLSATKPTRSGYAFLGWATSASATTPQYQPNDQFKNNTHTTLYAVWQKGVYRVDYTSYSGSNVPSYQLKVPGTPLTLSYTIPKRTGYAFYGWATSPSSATVAYQPGAQYKNNAHTTLHAVWMKGAYRVTYHPNGGSNAPAAVFKTAGTALKLSTQIPTRSGYAFVGWSTNASATTASYQPGAQITNDAHMVLYAVWKKDAYRVSFSANGGSGAPSAQIKDAASTLNLATKMPTRSGYAFVGWSTNASATTAQYQPGGSFKNNAHTTLYAVWKKDAYRVSFSSNGGSGAPSVQFKIPGTPLTLSSTMPKRSGYAFVGWSTSASATTASYQPGSAFKNNTHTTLYAVWKKDAYRVSFSGNGGSGAPSAQFKIPGTPLTLSSTMPNRSGYAFVGWSTSASATTAQYQPGSAFKNNAHTTFFAVWQKGAYRVSFDANGGTNAPGPQFKIPGTPLTLTSAKPTRANYTFAGWSTDKNATAATYVSGAQFKNNATTTLYAVWTPNRYTVTFDANGGSSAPSPQTKVYGTPLTLSTQQPTRTGYTFAGWSTNKNATAATYQSGAQYKNNGVVTLYAVWTPNRYTVTFNANGGSGAPSPQTKVHGVVLTLSSTKPTRSGYTFRGWATAPDSTSVTYLSGSTYANNFSTTLYAVWNPNRYTVTFNANGGSGAPSAQTKVQGTPLTLPTQQPTRAYHTFLGWSTDPNATAATYQSGGQYKNNGDTTLYAVWNPDRYTVTFDANGGSGAPSAQTKLHGVTLTLSTQQPTRSGYTFLGWSTNSDATTVTYESGDSYTINGDRTLYAVWERSHLTLTVNGSHTATISTGGREVQYSFTPVLSGTYRIYSTGSYDTRVYVYDENGNQIASDDDSGDNRNFSLECDLEAGRTYTYGVRFYSSSATGSFTFYFECADVYADELTVNSDFEAYIDTAGQEARYTFTPEVSGTYTIYSTGSSDTYVRLYDESGNQIAYNDDGGEGTNFRLERELQAGVTYIYGVRYLSSSTAGRITFRFESDAESLPELSLNQDYSATISSGGTKAMYTFTPTATGLYRLYSTGSSDTKAYLYDENGNPLATDDDSGENANFSLEYTLQAGVTYTYGIGYYSSSTTGTIAFRLTRSSLVLGQMHQAIISTGGNKAVYEFTPSVTGTYRLYSTGSQDTKAYLYDEHGSQITSNDDGGEGNNFSLEYTLQAGVTYMYGVGYYSSSTTGTITFYLEKAGLTPGGSYSASITTGGQEQRFEYTPSETDTYRIYSTGSEDTRVYLYDASGNQLASDDDSGDSYNFSLEYILEAGVTYTYAVRYYGSSTTGTISFYFQRV